MGAASASAARERVLTGHTLGVIGLAFSPDGLQIASVGEDGDVRFWDPLTGACTLVVAGSRGSMRALAFSPDGRRLATASSRGIVMWDPSSGKLIASLGEHSRYTTIAFSTDGRHVAGGGGDGSIVIYDSVTGEFRHVLRGHWWSITALAFSPDGLLLASIGQDFTIRLWKTSTGTLAAMRRLAEKPTIDLNSSIVQDGTSVHLGGLAFSPDGRQLASVNGRGEVQLWDIGSKRISPASSALTPGSEAFRASTLAISSNGGQLAVGGVDGSVHLFALDTGHVTTSVQGNGRVVTALALAPNGRQLAIPGALGAVELWDAALDRPSATGHPGGQAHTVVASADGRLLASTHSDLSVHITDAENGRLTFSFTEDQELCRPGTGQRQTAAFSGDGRYLVAVAALGTLDLRGIDTVVRRWDLGADDPTIAQLTTVSVSHVRKMALSADGRYLATKSVSRAIDVWDMAALERSMWDRVRRRNRPPLATIDPGVLVHAMAFSPDGSKLATAVDHAATVWNARTGRQITSLHGHYGSVQALAFSADGNRLAGGEYGGTVWLWDPVSGEPVGTMQDSTESMTALTFSPDGHELAIACVDGSVRVGPAQPDGELAALRVGVPITDLAWASGGIAAAAQSGLLHVVIRERPG